MRRFFLWWALLSKRTLRRPSCLAVLLAVPVLALLLSLATRQGGRVITAALWREDPADPAAAAAVERLLAEDGALRCFEARSEEEARQAVARGKADAAWLFRRGAADVLSDFDALGPPAVTVVEREDTVFLMLAREKLVAALYPELSYGVFARALRSLDSSAPDDAVLRRYYAESAVSDPVLIFSFADGDGTPAERFLSSPLRGLLAVLTLMAGLASALGSCREEELESFVWLPAGKRRLLPVLCHLTAVVPVQAASLAAVAAAGLLTGGRAEIPAALLFCLDAALFSELLRLLCGKERVLAALLPLLLPAALLLSPIFLDLSMLRPLQALLPVFHYLRAVLSLRGLLQLTLHTALLALITVPLALLRRGR